VISSSVADTQPVLDKILASCKHLFGGDELSVLLIDEQDQLIIAAYLGDFYDIVDIVAPRANCQTIGFGSTLQRKLLWRIAI
jgi:hypothetical protein